MTATSSDAVVIAAGRLPQRLALTTLGVADVALSRAFYKRLGFVASGLESDQVCFSEMQGTLFGLYRRLWEVAYNRYLNWTVRGGCNCRRRIRALER